MMVGAGNVTMVGAPDTAQAKPAGQPGSAVLIAKDIHKSFGEVEVLKGVSLEVDKGERICMIGRSGSGKTTFLRCLNLLETPTDGELEIAGVSSAQWHDDVATHAPTGRALAKHRAQVGMVFQHFELFPHLTAKRNVALGPQHVLGLSRAEAEQRACGLLERVGLGDRLEAYPATLSGGQRQRVAIARALGMGPKILLFDEPTSSLDPELARDVLVAIKELANEGTTMIIVTHEMRFAKEVATKVVVFDDGRIIEEGPPRKVLEDPANEQTRHFLRSVLAEPEPETGSQSEAAG